VPAVVEVQETVAVWDCVMLLGVAVQLGPEGCAVTERLIVPVNPALGVIVMVEVADWAVVVEDGLVDETVKSGCGRVRVCVAEAVFPLLSVVVILIVNVPDEV